MTRQEFLERHWKSYPLPSQQTLQLGTVGRILALDSHRLQLESGEAFSVTSQRENSPHLELGPEIPLGLLSLGDLVYVLNGLEKQQMNSVYLLSPCLKDPPVALDSGWAVFLRTVEDFFISQDFVHWPTPYLVTSPGVDAHIDFMKVSGVRTQRQFCLPTSPEIELKKVIVGGINRVFEIKSSFRDDDRSPIHKAEFKMLEWYRAYANKWELVTDIEKLISFIYQKMNLRRQVKIEKLSMTTLFKKHVGIELTPITSREELIQTLRQFHMDFLESDDWDDLFFRLYIEKVEPHLGLDQPVVIYDFPPSQSSIARLTEEGWADRFELYWRGVELANAYQEQNNPQKVRKKIESEVSKRKILGREPNPVDDEFLFLLEKGFPPCTGCAMGLDRLYMVIKDLKTIY